MPHEIGCPCPDCALARKNMVRSSHPLMQRRSEEPAPTMIPIEQALAMSLEERDDLEERLRIVEGNIKALRDCI